MDAMPIANPSLSTTSAVVPLASAPALLSAPSNATLVPPAASTDLAPPAAPGEAKEYVIAKGDTLGAIARKNAVSLKALMEANPGVNAKKLKIGQKVQIPAGTTALAKNAAPGASAIADAAPADESVYVVKPGDMLFKIAKKHGTTVKKIMAMNELKSTSIRAGQKLKLPAAKTTATEPASTPATASAAMLPAAAPMKVATASGSPVAAN
jgi:LysM repeat protein